MNERFLFRGKRKDNGEWETGFLIITRYDCSDEQYFITDKMTGYHTPVIPETIGQCTGLKDKNGNMIWENDVIKYHFGNVYAQIRYGAYKSCFDSQKAEHIGFYVDWSENRNYRKDLGYWINMVNAEVVGNIFDNQELLESEG